MHKQYKSSPLHGFESSKTSSMILFVCALHFFYLKVVSATEKLPGELYDSLIPESYKKHEAPSIANEFQELTLVVCGLSPTTVISFSSKEMAMRLEMGFYIGWKDSRLNLKVFEGNKNAYTVLPNKIADKLWFPLLSFGNCKQCTSSTLYKPGKETLFYNHRRDELYSWVRRSETFVCDFDMRKYPFDKQVCSVRIQSFRNQPLKMNYTLWQPDVTMINIPPGLNLYKFSLSNCSFDNDTFSSCNNFDFSVARVRVRPVLLIFFPSILIIVMSWVSFWLDAGTAAPRVALGLTSMLTLSTQFSSAQRDLPAVSTTMALDVWMFFSLFIVFASLIEFAIVSYLLKKSPANISPGPSKGRDSIENKTFSLSPQLIDKLSRIIFPLGFVLFNIVFWSVYL